MQKVSKVNISYLSFIAHSCTENLLLFPLIGQEERWNWCMFFFMLEQQYIAIT